MLYGPCSGAVVGCMGALAAKLSKLVLYVLFDRQWRTSAVRKWVISRLRSIKKYSSNIRRVLLLRSAGTIGMPEAC